MPNTCIITDQESGVFRILLNRPDKLNSVNAEMGEELHSALLKAGENPSIRAILLSGQGRAFCTGQDLAEVIPPKDGSSLDLGEILAKKYNPIIRAIRYLEKPVVCAVNGIAAGAGANIAFACDIVLASKEASFVQSFAKVGLIPDSGGTFFLPRLVGFQRANAHSMLAEKISAEEAERIGLVYKVVPGENLMMEAFKIAEYLSTQPTRGLGLIKRGLNQSLSATLDMQLEYEEKLQRMAGETEDYAEGVHAFLEKRAPKFKGK